VLVVLDITVTTDVSVCVTTGQLNVPTCPFNDISSRRLQSRWYNLSATRSVMFLDDISPSAITLTFDANTRSFRNPINRKDQFAKLQGDRWRATLSFNNLNQSEADAYVAWIMSLNGQVGTFNCPVVTQTLTSVVTVTSSTTSTVSVDNVGQLKAGKYFSSNGELKAITSISGTVISFKLTIKL
jgi:hypothetical protein